MSGPTWQSFEDQWARLDAEAQADTFSHQLLLRLIELYRGLDPAEREVADEVLTGWVLDGDPRQRFDALAMIDGFSIQSALPVIRTALERLEDDAGPSVPTDRSKLQRILAHLGSSQDG
jgi:hypothetical protein